MPSIRTLTALAACLMLTGCSAPQNGTDASGATDQVVVPAGSGSLPASSQVCEATAVQNMLVDLVDEQTFGKPLAEEKDITLFGTGKETSCYIGWDDGFGFVALTNFVSDSDAKASHDANVGAIASSAKPAKKLTGAASGAELAVGTKLDKKFYAKEGKEELLIHCVGVRGTLGVTVGFKLVAPALPQEEIDTVVTVLCTKADAMITDIQGAVNKSAAAGAIPSAPDPSPTSGPPNKDIAGRWSGPVTGDTSTYNIVAEIREYGTELVATVTYPKLNCKASWLEQSKDAEAVYFKERRTEGRCLDNLQVKLTKSNEQVLHVEFTGTTIQADMTRIGD